LFELHGGQGKEKRKIHEWIKLNKHEWIEQTNMNKINKHKHLAWNHDAIEEQRKIVEMRENSALSHKHDSVQLFVAFSVLRFETVRIFFLFFI